MEKDIKKEDLVRVKSGQIQPRTQISELRDLLKMLENRIAKLKEIDSDEALEILPLLDQATNKLTELNEAGAAVSGEATQLESLLMQLHQKRAVFVNRAGGASALQSARQEYQPVKDHWWWFMDQTLANERKSSLLRWVSGLLILGVLLVVIVFVYQRFFAPDPAFQASYGLMHEAEGALMIGDYPVALDKVNQALTYTPDDPDLYLMKGVIYQGLGDPEAAEASFVIARKGIDGEDVFLVERSRLYSMLNLFDLVIEDANMALLINPDRVSAYIFRGQAYEMLGDNTSAIADFEKASEVAEKIGNVQLQAVARMHLAQALQLGLPPETGTPSE